MPSSRYGTVLSNAEKRSNTNVKVYKMSSIFDYVSFQDEYISDPSPIFFPVDDNDVLQLFKPFLGNFYPSA